MKNKGLKFLDYFFIWALKTYSTTSSVEFLENISKSHVQDRESIKLKFEVKNFSNTCYHFAANQFRDKNFTFNK